MHVNWMLIVVFSNLLVLAACSISPATSAGKKQSRQGLVTETLLHENIKRTYHIQFPSSYSGDNTYPMVLVLHGGGGTGRSFDRVMTSGTLGRAANIRKLVLVYPEGVKKRWNDGRTEIIKASERLDDVGFLEKVIDQMIARYAIDSKRVYTTGISNGGFMTFRLALDLSNKLAAVAPVTAQLSDAVKNRNPSAPIALMLLNGTADPLVPYNGGEVRLFKRGRSRGKVLSTKETVQQFARFNDCTQTPKQRRQIDDDTSDGTSVEFFEYAACKDQKSVELVSIIGGGHTWPGGNQYLRAKRVGLVSREINGSDVILDFFVRHSR